MKKDLNEFLNEFKILVSGFYGIREMDEYTLKEYILYDIENYIREFVQINSQVQTNLNEIASDLEKNLDLKRKLQDSLLTLKKIKGPFELEHLIKLKLQEIK